MLSSPDLPAPLPVLPAGAVASLTHGVRRRVELIGRRLDKSEFVGDVTFSTVETEHGVVTVLAIRDRGERVPAPAEVQGLLEAVPDATVILTRAGRISRVNGHLEALFGYAVEELVGQRIDMLVAGATSALCPRSDAEYARSQVARPRGGRVDLTGKRKDGTEFSAEITAMVFDGARGPVVTASIRDTTARVESTRERDRSAAFLEQGQLRVELAQSQRLESLGQLAGGIAHDFNNLLGVIQSYAGFIGETLSTHLDERPADARLAEACGDLEQIQSAAGRAARLARRLLAFARRESIEPEVIDLNALVRDIEQLLAHTAGEHVSLATRLDPAICSIEADRGQIERILMNLVVNARDAMPDGGTLTIGTAGFVVDHENAEPHPPV